MDGRGLRLPRWSPGRWSSAERVSPLSDDPALLWPGHVSRSVSFEDAGTSRGRKESPMRVLAAGERVVLAEVAGPGPGPHPWWSPGAPAAPPPAPPRLRAPARRAVPAARAP